MTEDYIPNKAHQVEHKIISDGTFYGVVIELAQEFKDGWELNDKDYPVFNSIYFTVSLKRAKTSDIDASGTVVPPTTKTSPQTRKTAVDGQVAVGQINQQRVEVFKAKLDSINANVEVYKALMEGHLYVPMQSKINLMRIERRYRHILSKLPQRKPRLMPIAHVFRVRLKR